MTILLSFFADAEERFARLRRTSHFSCAAKKSNQKKAAPQDRSRDEATRLRESVAGFADSTSLCWQQTGPRPAGHPDGLVHHRLADPDGMERQKPQPRPQKPNQTQQQRQQQEQEQEQEKKQRGQQHLYLQRPKQPSQQQRHRYVRGIAHTRPMLKMSPSPVGRGVGERVRSAWTARTSIRATGARQFIVTAFLSVGLLLGFSVKAADFKPRVLDNFSEASPWKALTSDQISGSLRPVDAPDGKALCLDYNFNGVSGHAAMRRALPLTFPANYQFDFRLRGSGPANAFEFKLIDASGENVWWVSKPNTVFPADWTDVRYKARHISPAWGPLKDKTLRQTQFVEFTVYANEGGKGQVCIDDLRFTERAPTPTEWPNAVVTASSGNGSEQSLLSGLTFDASNRIESRVRHELELALRAPLWTKLGGCRYRGDSSLDSTTCTLPYETQGWQSANDAGKTQEITLNFGAVREFGAVTLRWLPDLHASHYSIDLSDDGRHWQTVRNVEDGNGNTDYLYLPESESRYLRISMQDGPSSRYGLIAVDVTDVTTAASVNSFIERIAREQGKGLFPRGFGGEQTYWTLVGIDGGHESALISEDGAIELARGAPSITPFVVDALGCPSIADMRATKKGFPSSRRHVNDWSSVFISQNLVGDDLPMPSVVWSQPKGTCLSPHSEFLLGFRREPWNKVPWSLKVDAFAQGTSDRSKVFARYTLTNDDDKPQELTLALAIQPFQVNPPVQFLTTPGGVSPIHQLAYEGGAVNVNGKPRVWPLATPTRFFATPFDQDMAAQHLTYSDWPTAQSVDDETGLASGALLYTMELKPHESKTVSLMIPLTGTQGLPRLAPGAFEPWVDAQRDAVAAEWREKLDRVKISVPPVAQPIVDTLRTALAHILINRDGVQIRPGTRSYARSWIRDGAMTSEALLRLGHEKEASDFLEWFAPYQFANGKVPCCVDKRGSDPVPENDSHGELMFLAAEVFRYGGDKALAEKMWPHVDKAARYMDGLRASERTPANAGTERYGLLPPTISHEGYSAKPAYSYWDDFWGLIGYKSALTMAQALGKDDDARRLRGSIDQFRADIVATIQASAKKHAIDFIPGAADLGDFDATSTTMALSPGDELQHLPRDLLVNTFERYWREFVQRRDGQREWKDYTPYEWRNVAAFIRLGWRDRAHEAIAFFFKDRRPEAWNQWAEVVGKDDRESRFIGDMPHGWVASDYIRSALDLFAYERESDQSLVIAAGIPANWLDGQGVAIDGLRTPHGPLAYSLRRDGDRVLLNVKADGFTLPAGGLHFVPPELGTITSARINDRDAEWDGKELKISRLPAEVVLQIGKTATR